METSNGDDGVLDDITPLYGAGSNLWTFPTRGPPLWDSIDLRCNHLAVTPLETLTVAAGDEMGFQSNEAIYHPGPLLVYLGRVPEGKTAQTWEGDGVAVSPRLSFSHR